MIDQIRSTYFPAELNQEITVRAISRETFFEVTGQISNQIFTSQTDLGLYVQPIAPDAPARILSRQIPYEYFAFYNANGEPVGFSVGKLTDGITFFMEWSGILPAYHRQGIYSSFLKKLLPYLQELGIERVTSNHMGTNRPVLIAKLKAGFVVTGMAVDERHGMVVWLTLFLNPKREAGFRQAFSLDSFT